MNATRTMWLGMFAEYSLDSQGVEVRKRQQIVLCPVRLDSSIKTKRDAQRLLQPYLDKVNASIAQPSRERKTITLVGFESYGNETTCLCRNLQLNLLSKVCSNV